MQTQLSNTKRLLSVVPYDSNWPLLFKKEQIALAEKLGPCVIQIEHIGSTSVKGLNAKPIIDILVEVSNLQSFDAIAGLFEEPEYELKGENGIARRRYIQKGGNERSHHIHIFASGDNNLLRHRAFAQYLQAKSDIAAEYAKVKINAVALSNNDMNTYMTLKNEFIQHHQALAIKWYETEKRSTNE